MEIKNAKYIKSIPGNTNTAVQATIDGEEWSVPMNEDNRFYQAILEWVADGNTIEEAD